MYKIIHSYRPLKEGQRQKLCNQHILFRPLVVGSPRSGFSLLGSVLSNFVPLAPAKRDLGSIILKRLAGSFGDHVANEITKIFHDLGMEDDLIFSPNFRLMTGGPKWLRDGQEEQACFRKYIGVRGKGDFTLITTHPREILDCDDIVHSHVDAQKWASDTAYSNYLKFTSIRNPIGIVNSSLFSLNALTSEYIQRYIAPEKDNHALRESLALYKFTNVDFFEGLLVFYKKYFEEYLKVRDTYVEMRWEDLLSDPVGTITALARSAGLKVDADHAAQIWGRIGHINLTGSHKHNLRKGGGIPGDWKNWMTNRHLEMMRDFDFEPILVELGYGDIPQLDEGRYTPFQLRVSGLMAKGEVYDDFPDTDLFGFAFNKSNMDSSKFSFNSYDWKKVTRIERSCFTEEEIMLRVWDVAEVAVSRLNKLFFSVLAETGFEKGEEEALLALDRVKSAANDFSIQMPKAYEAVFPGLETMIKDYFNAKSRGEAADDSPPQLIRSIGLINVVSYNGLYYGIPQSAGPIDLSNQNIEEVPGIVAATSFSKIIDLIAASNAV